MAIFVLIWLVCAIAAGALASKKNRSVVGWGLLGFFFGPIGLLFAAIAGDNRKVEATLSDQLEELKRLKKRGVLSEEEYASKKTKILSS